MYVADDISLDTLSMDEGEFDDISNDNIPLISNSQHISQTEHIPVHHKRNSQDLNEHEGIIRSATVDQANSSVYSVVCSGSAAKTAGYNSGQVVYCLLSFLLKNTVYSLIIKTPGYKWIPRFGPTYGAPWEYSKQPEPNLHLFGPI